MKKAFTLIEILIVVSIIALIAAIGVPSFIGSQKGAKDQIKLVNISTVNAAKDQWSILYNKLPGEEVDWTDIAEYIGGGIKDQDGLNVDNDPITIGVIGESSTYY